MLLSKWLIQVLNWIVLWFGDIFPFLDWHWSMTQFNHEIETESQTNKQMSIDSLTYAEFAQWLA